MSPYNGSYWSNKDWKEYHEQQRQKLTKLFGGIDQDIQKLFFSLSNKSLDELFKNYGNDYGKNSERYARKTFKKWKSGEVGLSGQTSERLLNLVPPYISQEIKYELIKKLRNYYLKTTTKYITTTYFEWENQVILAIKELIKSSCEFTLPKELIKKAIWLSSGDVELANKILTSIELEKTKIKLNYFEAELRQLQQIIEQTPHTQSINYLIELPQGNIEVIIKEEKQIFFFFQRIFGGEDMKHTKNELVSKNELEVALSKQQDLGYLLNLSINDLTKEQKQKLTQTIMEAQFGLEVSQAEAELRFKNSARDMINTINTVNKLEQSSNNDFDIRQTYETASGKADIHVKRTNNLGIIIAIIIIGIVAVVVLSSK